MYENKLVCKICGGTINADESGKAGVCPHCGLRIMYPRSDIKKLNRINYLRNIFRFDEGLAIAKELISANPDDSEAYWAALLCEYGVQYVREGTTRLAVCRKDISALPALKESEHYKHAMYYLTEEHHTDYDNLASQLEDSISITRTILNQDKKYDVFILSRDGISVDDDLDGDKIYLRFTANLGFSVFYAPEMLKEMDAVERAAHIIYGLKNSRIMIPGFKTKDDVYDGFLTYAVNMFCADMKGKEDSLIFPVFNGKALDFQQLPEALVWCDEIFDSSNDDFMREISDKVESILKPEVNAIVPDDIVTATAANKENLVKRAYMFLEDGEFDTADSYFDKILDIDIEDSRAYIGKLLAECKLRHEEDIRTLPQTVPDDKNYKKALRFATPEQKAHYESLNNTIVNRIESERAEIAEQRAKLRAEREEKEAAQRERRMRQEVAERKALYQRRRDPLRKTLLEVQAELGKTFISPKRKKELAEEEETLKKNLRELDAQFPDIFD